MQVTKTQAIKAFLTAKTHSDLAELYSYNQEVQITVAQDNGERVEGDFKGRQWHGYSDGIQTWKPIRIPLKANTEPEYTDTNMTWDLSVHAEGIGMTGWDWVNKLSRWVAFDFDAITGHSEKHSRKLSDEQLQEIQNLLMEVPYVTIRKSTGGKGLHVYVFLNPIETANHTEHAAVARAILSNLSALANFDFNIRVDTCGGNMWVWHRKMTPENEGLKIIKKGTTLANVPPNWKDYLSVVAGRRTKNLPRFVEPSDEDVFAQLTGQRLRIKLDECHKELMNYITDRYPSSSWWDAEHYMFVTHTALLKEAHTALKLRGQFDTIASGEQRGFDHNCFSGDTEVLTKEGVKTFKELEGKTIELLVKTDKSQEWIQSKIESFGIQKTYPILFGDKTEVRATYNHMWLNRKGERLATHELIEGKTQLPIASRNLPEIDWEGYAHGFVFGDGWNKNTRGKETTEVALFKYDNDLKELLCRFGNLGSQYYEGHGYINMVRQLPKHWKDLPEKPTKEYALGFILGLASADGFLDTRLQIFQSNYYVLETIRKLAIYCGLRPYTIRLVSESGGYKNSQPGYAISISTYNLSQDHFLRKDHKEIFKKREKHTCMTVSSIAWHKPIEEKVYCAIVPKYHNFALANLVFTGNCYGFPLQGGAWSFRRYSLGAQEHPFWKQDGIGWTSIFFNRDATLEQIAVVYKGQEKPKGGFWFENGQSAIEAAKALGVDLQLPEKIAKFQDVTLKIHKSGKLVVEVDKKDTPLHGWVLETKKYTKMFNIPQTNPQDEIETIKMDERIRHIITESGEDCGWMINADNEWHQEPFSHIKVFIKGLGYKLNEENALLSNNIAHCWKLVNLPFREEYPSNRQWNRYAAKLRFNPSLNRDDLNYPTWTKVLNHLGTSLNEAVANNPWCKANNIINGADYLKCWIASLFKEPSEPLPYLFFYGEQDSGKSIFHEMLSLLMLRGVARADTALTSSSGFNGELEGMVLCAIEETDMRKNTTAYNRIKDWVTSRHLSIHKKGRQPYLIPNTTHYVQTANSHLACPIFPGDTRITMIYVGQIEPENMIPKKQIIPMLEKEAPDFLAEILNLELPPSPDRLNIPCLATEDKALTEESNKTQLQLFIEKHCFYAPGHWITFKQFKEAFHESLDPQHIANWTQPRIAREFPREPFVKGRSIFNNDVMIGNCSLTKVEEKDFKPKYFLLDGKLRQ